MYNKFEIVLLYLSCKNLTELFNVTAALKYIEEDTNDYSMHDAIRRLANNKIVTLIAGSKL
jgi:hypothetical protein